MKPTATASTVWCCLARARGEARPDSDYDIAVFLKDPNSFRKESGRLAEIETDILYETGAIINALPFPAGAYRERTPLMHEVRREGLDLRRSRNPAIISNGRGGFCNDARATAQIVRTGRFCAGHVKTS
ncbi:MAG: nucleotidyltransferase domain-containing protein, partial [Methylocella sp.]